MAPRITAEQRLERKLAAQEGRARTAIGVLVALMAAGGLLHLWGALFPDLPPTLTPSDGAVLQRVLFGGAPGVVLCSRDGAGVRVDAAARAAFEDAHRRSRNGPVRFYSLDCNASLPSGATAASRFNLQPARPQLFYVGYGQKPAQLSPALLLDGATRKPRTEHPFDVELARLAVNKHMRVGSAADVASCVRERTGGCVILVSTRRADALAEALLPAVLAAHPTVKIATLNGTTYALQPPVGSVAHRVYNGIVRFARDAAAAAGTGARGEVLVAVRRVPPALAGGDSGSLLFTAAAPAAPGEGILDGDVAALLAKAARAMGVLESVTTATAAGTAVVDALLERDERLEAAADSAVIAAGGAPITVVRAGAKSKATPTATPVPASSEAMPSDAATGRAQGRAARDKARRAAAGDDADRPSMTEIERRARAAMAEEEASSAYVAHPADADAESSAQGRKRGEDDLEYAEVEDDSGDEL